MLGERIADLDVTEAGGRVSRLDADRHQPTVAGRRHGAFDALGEPGGVADQVIGSEGSDDRVRVTAFDQGRRQSDRGHRVARQWLGHDVGRVQAGQLRPDSGPVCRAGDHHHAGLHQRREALDRCLQQAAAAAGQVVQELRRVGPGQRPEPRSGATGRDHGPEAGDGGHDPGP